MRGVPDTSTGYFISRFRNLFGKGSQEDMIGDVLVKKRVITKDELDTALEDQKDQLFELGKAVPLGEVIVDRGYTTEKKLVDVINEHYDISISSLSDNFRDLLKKIRGSFNTQSQVTRLPIWLQLAVATLFVLSVSITIFGYVIMERQKAKFFDQTVKMGMVSLNYFSNNAKVPLLNEDILGLNTLINNAATIEGHHYAFIVDSDGIIKAHTDYSKIEKPFRPFSHVDNKYKKGDVSYFDYTEPGKAHILNLSTPILFKDKKLGEVHVGLSIDFVNEMFITERAFLAGIILVVITFGMFVAVLFGMRFSRPISKLVAATAEIGKGNYQHKVNLKRFDELGTLAESFNKMGDELYRQSMMRESFGKYVGSEVLDLIMKNPEAGWLKGRTNKVSVLFADIRGFTAYSESKEPEQVVEKLNRFFEVATEVIIKHGGYVDKFMGDSVLAVFGVPVYHKDHEERCLRAAIDMQEELGRRAQEGDDLLKRVGIGVASGIVVAGNIGSQVKTEYTVIGDCVNVASYLNNIAGAGEIIIGNGMGKNFNHLIDVEPLEPRKVKGKEELVMIYRVVGSKIKAP